jgi:hypothetical protein
VEKLGGGHVAARTDPAARSKQAVAIRSAAAAAARAMAPALRWSGGAVCAVPSAVASLFRRRGRHLSKRQPVTSAAQHRGMARSSLLFALVILVAAALFAQLPLAGAAA